MKTVTLRYNSLSLHADDVNSSYEIYKTHDTSGKNREMVLSNGFLIILLKKSPGCDLSNTDCMCCKRA